MESEVLNQIQEAYVSLSEIEAVILEAYGDGFYTDFRNTETHTTLQTNFFIITFSHDKLRYYLSYGIDTDCRIVAETTIMITSFLSIKDLSILEDNYYDHKNRKLVYGIDAIHAKKDYLLYKEGIKECVICNGLVAEQLVDKSGFCDHCAKNKNEISWH